MLDATNNEETISGFVHIPGEMRNVRVQQELLVLSVASWLRDLAERRLLAADEAMNAGCSEDAVTTLVDEAAALSRVARDGWLADPDSVGIEFARRAAVPEWRVEGCAEAEAYGRRLIQQDAGGAEGVEWVFGFGDDGAWTLLLPPRLHHLLAYVGSYVEGGIATRADLAGFVELLAEVRVG